MGNWLNVCKSVGEIAAITHDIALLDRQVCVCGALQLHSLKLVHRVL